MNYTERNKKEHLQVKNGVEYETNFESSSDYANLELVI